MRSDFASSDALADDDDAPDEVFEFGAGHHQTE